MVWYSNTIWITDYIYSGIQTTIWIPDKWKFVIQIPTLSGVDQSPLLQACQWLWCLWCLNSPQISCEVVSGNRRCSLATSTCPPWRGCSATKPCKAIGREVCQNKFHVKCQLKLLSKQYFVRRGDKIMYVIRFGSLFLTICSGLGKPFYRENIWSTPGSMYVTVGTDNCH